MSRFIQVTESTLGLNWDENKVPYHYRTNHSSLINVDDIIKIEDHYIEGSDDIHNCCRIVLDKRKYGDCNTITVLDRYPVLCNLINPK